VWGYDLTTVSGWLSQPVQGGEW